MKIKIRMLGIDTPEIRGSGTLEKQAAKKVKNYVSSLILNKILNVIFFKWDKYGGRVNGNIYLNDDITLKDHLIEKGFGKAYDGGRKHIWSEEELNNIIHKA